MNTIVMLVGAPGSGKSTWIKENGLENYAISADTIRLMYSAPVVDKSCAVGISNRNDKKVWDTLWKILKERMNLGSLTVLDTCGLSSSTLGDVKGLCRKFGYKLLIKKFDDSNNIELLKIRNKRREEYKRVPESVIEYFHERYKKFDFSKLNVIHSWIWGEQITKILGGDKYERVFVIGDVHGCVNTLEVFFETYKPSEKDLVIFTGDLVDRGIHNKETILKLMSLNNAAFVKGNHDRWLCYYANKNFEFIKNDEFLEKTAKELDGIDKDELQAFCEKFQNDILLQKGEVLFYITHGGVPFLNRGSYTCSSQLVNGVGTYPEVYEVDKMFNDHQLERSYPCYSIHGHRNPERKEMNYYKYVFNLEGRVEYGEELRFVIIHPGGDVEKGSIPTHQKDFVC